MNIWYKWHRKQWLQQIYFILLLWIAWSPHSIYSNLLYSANSFKAKTIKNCFGYLSLSLLSLFIRCRRILNATFQYRNIKWLYFTMLIPLLCCIAFLNLYTAIMVFVPSLITNWVSLYVFHDLKTIINFILEHRWIFYIL